MNAIIDFSVFTDISSLGNIHGRFNIDKTPQAGEYLELNLSDDQSKKFLIENVSEESYEDQKYVLIMLEDLIVEKENDFQNIGKYLEKEHGLYIDDFTSNDS